MKSFSKLKSKYLISATFVEYGGLIALISISLAAIELFLFGLKFAIPELFVITALFVSIALARFFTVHRSNESDRRHRVTTIYNWTIYLALLTGLIWGSSCFFYPTSDPLPFMIHILFLVLIASVFSIFFSSLPIISTFLILIILAPLAVLLFLSPALSDKSIPTAILFVSVGLIILSFLHGKKVHAVYEQMARQRKIRLRLRAKEKQVKTLERVITRKVEKSLRQKKGPSAIEPTTKVLSQAPNEAVAVLTADGLILETNDLFKELTDHQTITIGSTVFSHLFPKKMRDTLDIALQTAIATGQEISFTITHSGKLRRVLFVPSLDGDKNVMDVTVLFDDDAIEEKNREDLIAQNNRTWDNVLSLTSPSNSLRTWQSHFTPALTTLCHTLKANHLFIIRENGECINDSNPPVNDQYDHSYHWIFSVGPWMSILHSGEAIHNINSQFPRIKRGILKKKNIHTLALTPVFQEGKLWGIFGMVKTGTNGYFTNQQTKVLRLLANILTLHVQNEKNSSDMQRLTTVIEQSEDCIMITDPEGVIQYSNPACEHVTGYTPDELTDKNVQQLHVTDNRSTIWQEVDAALQQKEKWHGQFINKRKDHTLYEEEMILSPVYNHEKDMVNLVIIKRNITEAKRLESIAEAANLMDNIGFIFSSLRHELGNPINSLKVSLSILESNLNNYDREDIKRFLSRNLSDIKRVEYILTLLKNFSVFEKPRVEPVNMVDIIDGFTNLIKPDIQKKEIRLVLNISDKNMPGLIDPRAFQQVLLNLITNAIDALENTSNKRITLTMYKEENNQINLTIGDNGCGIDESEQTNLFRPFFTTKPKGTGLGLVIVKKMLAKMNCSIDIHSKKSVGTQIFIIIPGPKKP